MKSLLIVTALIGVLSSCGIRRHDPNTIRLIPQTVYSFKTDSTGKIISKEKKVVYAPVTVIHRSGRSSSPDVGLTQAGTSSSRTIDSLDEVNHYNQNYHIAPRSGGEYP